MAKKWYISPIIGTGTMHDKFRSKIADTGIAQMAYIPANPDGTPRFPFALVLVSGSDFSTLDADAQLDGFPGVSLDDPISSVSAAVRNKIQTALTNRGVDLTGITLSNTFRDLLVLIAQKINVTASDINKANML